MVEAVEALKAMFQVENGSSGLGKRTKAFERNPAYTDRRQRS